MHEHAAEPAHVVRRECLPRREEIRDAIAGDARQSPIGAQPESAFRIFENRAHQRSHSALFHRTQAVNAPSWHAPTAPADYELVTLDGRGNSSWQVPVSQSRALVGSTVEGSIVSHDGVRTAVTGHYYPYDHLPGGWLFFPRSEGASRAEFVVDGVTNVARR